MGIFLDTVRLIIGIINKNLLNPRCILVINWYYILKPRFSRLVNSKYVNNFQFV
jgi:hypothetical protein